MRRKLKLAFTDFWEGFECNPTGKSQFDNQLYKILAERFDIEITENPEVLIYSVFGNNHKKYTCKKIFFAGENVRPNFTECQYAITFDYLNDERNLRFPLSAVTLYEWGIRDGFDKAIDCEKIKREKTKFCNFVFSNPNAPLRNKLFEKLSRYKKIDSGGKVFNNLGHCINDKLQFLNEYKFTIAFENSEYPGYTTEKLVHPKLVNSIPIYWGNPEVHKDWNTKAFISAYDFWTLGRLVEYIKKVDNNDELYFNMLKEPHFNTPKSNDLESTTLIRFFESVVLR